MDATSSGYTLICHVLGTMLSNFGRFPMNFDPQNNFFSFSFRPKIKLKICIKYCTYGQICKCSHQAHIGGISHANMRVIKYLITPISGVGFLKIDAPPPPQVLMWGQISGYTFVWNLWGTTQFKRCKNPMILTPAIILYIFFCCVPLYIWGAGEPLYNWIWLFFFFISTQPQLSHIKFFFISSISILRF